MKSGEGGRWCRAPQTHFSFSRKYVTNDAVYEQLFNSRLTAKLETISGQVRVIRSPMERCSNILS